ncbi:MAG: homoserine O-acetyltransferase [Candidatus Bathyarchaeota archaeon]|nr:homoserine O-acetyltransferase [Candidatus Bathyarchaeota archaeon]
MKDLTTTEILDKTETKYFTFAHPPYELTLESGEKLGPITLAYETYGKLNEQKSNAILVLHALSGDAHAAGISKKDGAIGWWNNLIGPNKGIDTNKYFVVCSNVIGGCKGSTGPSSINPKTGKPYGIDFPIITIGDMVNAQRHLIDHLGIEKLLAVIGGSMGGMQVLQWMVAYPERIRAAIPIATALRHTPQQIAFNEVGRQAVMADPNWRMGNYYDGPKPANGLAVARMIGHITYMSHISMEQKFGRRLRTGKEPCKFGVEFEVEGYLRYRGDTFVKRFDANSYLYITKAMDYFDLLNGKPLNSVFKGLNAKVLVIAFKSDWLYPPYQSQEIVKACKLAGVEAAYCEINSTYGHDAFLLEIEEEAHLIKHFLNRVSNDLAIGV